LSGKYGLTIDNLLTATIVLADGSIVTASNDSHTDLFWAIRGCGASFGVAVAFKFRAYEQKDPVWAGLLVFPPNQLEGVVKFVHKHHEVSNGDQALSFGFSAPPPHGQPAVLAAPFFNGPEDEAEKYFSDLLALGPIVNHVGLLPYEKLNGMLNPATNFGGRKTGGASAVKLPLEVSTIQNIYDEFTEFITTHEGCEESLILFEIIPYHKTASVPIEDTAYANRGEYYNVGTLFKWYNPELDGTVRSFSRAIHKKVREQGGVASTNVGAYANYVDYVTTPEKVFGVNTTRLVELKKKYDPQNLFYRWHNLLPTTPLA
jgi:hypothetical protein